jgi:hypothetical protein
MKKLALILALIMIPCSAFGLEMLSDTTMDGITGQAGVNIAMDDIQIFMNIEKLAWIDCDGFQSYEGKGTCAGAGGAIVLNNFQLDVLNINAIVGQTTPGATVNGGLDLISTTCGNIPLFYNYATTGTSDGCYLNGISTQHLGLNNSHGGQSDGSAANNFNFVPHFLTIDVTDALPASTQGFQFWAANSWTSGAVAAGTSGAGSDTSTVGGVLIGIPTVEIYINAMSFTPMYDGDINGLPSNAANDDDMTDVFGNHKTFGTVYMQGITFTTLGGWIEISPK